MIEQHELRRGPFAELLGRDVGSAASPIIVDTDEHTLLVPPIRSHRVAKTGPDRLDMIDIHQSPQFITKWIYADRPNADDARGNPTAP